MGLCVDISHLVISLENFCRETLLALVGVLHIDFLLEGNKG